MTSPQFGVVELVGPSGSGKTSVARALLGLRAGLVPGRRSLFGVRQDSSTRSVVELLSIPGVALRVGFVTMRNPRTSSVWRRIGPRRSLAIWMYAARNRAARAGSAQMVQDQGLLHCVAHAGRHWTPQEREDRFEAIYRALGGASLPRVAVCLDVCPQLIAERTKMRNPIHRDEAEIARVQAALDQSVAAAERSGRTVVQRVQSAAGVQEVAEIVWASLVTTDA